MDKKIQYLSSIDNRIIGEIKRSPRIRLITLYRQTRQLKRISSIGDSLLIYHLVYLYNRQTKNRFNRWQLNKVFNSSVELNNLGKKDKSELLNDLDRFQNDTTVQKK